MKGMYSMPKSTAIMFLILFALVAVTGIMAACTDKSLEPFHDAPRGVTNDEPADIVTMPDGFSNVATKCDHGNRVYVVFHGDGTYGSISVVPDDPTCAG